MMMLSKLGKKNYFIKFMKEVKWKEGKKLIRFQKMRSENYKFFEQI